MGRGRLGRFVMVISACLLVASCGGESDEGEAVPDSRPPDPGPTEDPSAAFFDPAILHDVRMEVAERDLDRLEPPTDERVPVRLTVDGMTVEHAGVRLKGGSAQYQGLDEKPGFSIKTDEFVDGLDILGVRRFTLGNAALDGSFVAEHLVYTLYREADIPVARTAMARLTFNDETFGLYVMRESYDKRWLARHFEDPEGNLYEAPDEGGTLDTELEPRTNERSNDSSDLEAIAEVVATASDEDYRDLIEDLVDVDELLTYWAIETLTGHWDGYLYDITTPGLVPPPARPPGNPSINNYYAYHDPVSGQLVIIPHGADLTFGLGGRTWEFDTFAPVLTAPKSNATIAARLWEQPGFDEELASRIGFVLEEIWDPSMLVAEAELMADHVRSDGLTGSREWITPAGFEEALADRKAFIGQRGPAVRAELAAHAAPSPQQPIGS